MKLKNIESICKSGAEIIRVDVGDEEKLQRVFLGTEYAQYAIPKNVWLDATSYLDLFGIDEKKAEKWHVDWEIAEDEEAELYADNYPGEKECVPLNMTVTLDGVEWGIYKIQNGLVFFVPTKWTAGIDDSDSMTRFYFRDGHFLAIKRGLVLEGLVKIPSPVFNDNMMEMMMSIKKVAALIQYEPEGAKALG